MKVKYFRAENLRDLERTVNSFLLDNQYVDVQFQPTMSAYYAQVIFEEEPATA